MDAATQFNVVFNGTIREGFERKTVARALAQKLRLNGEQIKRLFDGSDHTLKRASTEDEAKRIVMRLAQLGAVARIATPVTSPRAAVPTSPAKKRGKTLAPFAPLKSVALFKPLLYMAVSAEAAITVFYFVLLLGLCYFSFFTLWASPISEFPLLMLSVQLASIPLLALMLLLLAKPLLSLRMIPYRGVHVSDEQEPDMGMFVQDVCERLGVVPPAEIRLNNDVEIAVYHRGPFGFWRNEYVLAIGVPLIAGLKANQLAALLMRELLCFRNRESPRAGFLLMAVHRWLHTALHREDPFDLGLKRWQEHGRLSSGTVKKLQRLFNISRQLMIPRQAVSLMLGRRLVHAIVAMADEEACILAGREGLSQALEQQRLLAHTFADVVPRLQKQWDEKGVLPDDLVQLTLLRARQYPASIHGHLRAIQEQQKTAEDDPIPADAQRIDRLRAASTPPEYACVSPAHTLLHYFTKLVTTMSVRYYHNRLNIPITPNKLIHPVLKGSVEEQLNNQINGWFNGLLHLMQPLNLQSLMDRIGGKAEARQQWQTARQQIKSDHTQAKHDYSLNLTTEKQLNDNSMREGLYRAGLWNKLGDTRPKKDEMEAFLQQCREVENEYEQTLARVGTHQRFYAQRLAAALAMLRPPEEEEDHDHRYMEMVMLLTVYGRIESVLPNLRELKLSASLLNILLSYLNSDRPSMLRDRIEEVSADIRQLITGIKLALKDVPTPFTVPRGGKVLVDYLLLESYRDITPEGHYDRGNDVVVRLALVQKRILARLIEMAGEAEQSLS